MEKTKISAVVITYNEEKNIEKCLKSLLWADEIIIVDSFSTDKTIDICQQYPVKIFQKTFAGYATQRNFGIEKATSEWVLMIDADEIVSPELSKEIIETIKGQKEEINAYYVPTKNFSFGGWLLHGNNFPDYHLRLFRRNKCKYFGEIHEKVKFEGKTAYLKHPLIHKNYSSISEYLPKLNSYTDIEAQEMMKKKLKISWWKIITFPVLRFLWTYVIKNGWRDGFAGFLMSVFGSFYMLTKYLKYKELTKNANRD